MALLVVGGCVSALAFLTGCGAPATSSHTSDPSTLSCRSLGALDRLDAYRTAAFPQNHTQFTVPAQVTVTDASAVQSVAAALCALPVDPIATHSCPVDLGIAYQLWFSSGRSTAAPVTVEAGGCNDVTGLATKRTALGTSGFWSALGAAMNVPDATRATFAGTRDSAPTSSVSASAAPPPATPMPSITTAELTGVAAAAISPTGHLCDTHRDNGPSDVNACPYTKRLKDFIDARYQRAWSGQGNPNPVLSAQPACSDGSEHVSYDSAPNGSGGTVTIITCGQADQAWQRLVMVRSGPALLVDDILVDSRHQGNFVSVYASA